LNPTIILWLSHQLQSVFNWENDTILPSIEILKKIAAYFSVSTDYLLGLDKRRTFDVTGLSDTQDSACAGID